MSSSSRNDALGQYRTTDAYGAAASGDRLQLISKMMQGALDRIATARGHLQRDEAAEKGEQIGRAIGLVDGLRVSLDLEGGQEIAANLDALYQYMLNRLMEASMNNDDDALVEVSGLLAEIKSGWENMSANYRPETSIAEPETRVGV